MIRRVGVVVSTTLAAGLFSMAVAMPALAAQPSKEPPPSGDPRATSFAGNATTCKDANLDGKIILKDDNPPEGQQYLTIKPEDIPEGFELTGTVVKGGDGYNVYPPSALTELHAPLVGQNNNVPTISHWFACGKKKTTTTTTSSSGSSSSNASTTTSPAAQGSNGSDLASTGASTVGPLVAGSALVLVGGGLLYWLRRTRRQS